MFTGIVEEAAPVIAVSKSGNLSVRIKRPLSWRLAKGESIAVDGVCSTVVRSHADWFEVVYMKTTLEKTAARYLKPQTQVNLERSLRFGDRVSGHFVSGHVDAVVPITSIGESGSNPTITIPIPRVLGRFIALRGSIAVSGVSLTIARRSRQTCTVALIPYTTANTTLGRLKKGDNVNIEVDLLARYGKLPRRATLNAR